MEIREESEGGNVEKGGMELELNGADERVDLARGAVDAVAGRCVDGLYEKWLWYVREIRVLREANAELMRRQKMFMDEIRFLQEGISTEARNDVIRRDMCENCEAGKREQWWENRLVGMKGSYRMHIGKLKKRIAELEGK